MNLQKKIYIAIGAAGIVLLGYVFYINYNSSKRTRFPLQMDALYEDVRKLGTIKLTPEGYISFDHFMAIVRIISKHSKLILEQQNQDLINQRREALRFSQMKVYRDIAIKQARNEEDTYQKISEIVMKELNMSEQDFSEAQQFYMQQPDYQSAFFQFQQQEYLVERRQKPRRVLTREQTLEMFKYSEQLKMESGNVMNELMTDQSDSDITTEMMIQQAIMADKLYLRYGVEEEEFNQAMAKHNIYADPQAHQLMSENLKQLPPDMMEQMMQNMMNNSGGPQGENDSF